MRKLAVFVMLCAFAASASGQCVLNGPLPHGVASDGATVLVSYAWGEPNCAAQMWIYTNLSSSRGRAMTKAQVLAQTAKAGAPTFGSWLTSKGYILTQNPYKNAYLALAYAAAQGLAANCYAQYDEFGRALIAGTHSASLSYSGDPTNPWSWAVSVSSTVLRDATAVVDTATGNVRVSGTTIATGGPYSSTAGSNYLTYRRAVCLSVPPVQPPTLSTPTPPIVNPTPPSGVPMCVNPATGLCVSYPFGGSCPPGWAPCGTSPTPTPPIITPTPTPASPGRAVACLSADGRYVRLTQGICDIDEVELIKKP